MLADFLVLFTPGLSIFTNHISNEGDKFGHVRLSSVYLFSLFLLNQLIFYLNLLHVYGFPRSYQ